MIIFILGGIGSGKTLSAVREIVQSKSFSVVNFDLKGIKNYHRLRYEDIIKTTEDKLKNKTVKKQSVNWDFWNELRKKHKNFSIFLDEAHGIISSRNSMSKKNQMMSNWIAQIRKIYSDSKNAHIYIISQSLRRIDINFRDLVHVIILARKIEIGSKVLIVLKYFDGVDGYENNIVKGKEVFTANPYFKYYNTLEMVQFGEGETYV